ncbi:hypothetical protein OAG34_01170 [bacterium]|nr:hypothetical protein [bacterium]
MDFLFAGGDVCSVGNADRAVPCCGRDVVDAMLWTPCRGSDVVDAMSWTPCGRRHAGVTAS